MGRPPSSTPPLVMPRCVLVVEDDAILAMEIEQTLRDAGVTEIGICSTTHEAVAFLRNKRPDALVLDVHLADRSDGYSIAELVSVLKPQEPKIVFSTGSPADIPSEISRMGVVLEKPYRAEELVAALSKKPKGIMSLMRSKGQS